MGCTPSASIQVHGRARITPNSQWDASHIVELKNMSLRDKWTLPPYVPKITRGFVSKVYDGDTITIIAHNEHIENTSMCCGFIRGDPRANLYQFPVRLAGIDCPELRTSNDTEKRYATRAKNALSVKILHTYVQLSVLKMDKFGRVLADLFEDKKPMSTDTSVAQWMVDNRYAIPYSGKTKTEFSEKNFTR
jgi:endonuclease YncB( thermonuclease family)